MRAWRSVSTYLAERVPVWILEAIAVACALGVGFYLGAGGRIPAGWWWWGTP